MTSRDDCLTLDAADALAPLREMFSLNDDEIYLDGNSLGPVSRTVATAVNEVVENQLGKGLVRNLVVCVGQSM